MFPDSMTNPLTKVIISPFLARMKMAAKIFRGSILLLICLGAQLGYSQNPLDISEISEPTPISSYVSYLFENHQPLSPEEVFTFEDNRFTQVGEDSIVFSHRADKIWLKLKIWNSSNQSVTRAFDMNTVQGNPLIAYAVIEGQVEELLRSDAQTNFSERPIRSRNLKFELHLLPQQSATLLIRYGSDRYLRLPMEVEPIDQLMTDEVSDNLLIMAFITALSLIIIVSLVHYGALRERVFLFYSLRQFSILLFAIANWGFGFQYLWPNLPLWNTFSITVIAGWVILCCLLFVVVAIKLPQRYPFFYNGYRLMMLIVLTLLILTPFIGARWASKLLLVCAATMAFIVPISLSWIVFKGSRVAFYVLVGNIIGGVATALYALQSLAVIDLGINPTIYISSVALMDGVLIYFGIYKHTRESTETAVRSQVELFEQKQLTEEETLKRRQIAEEALKAEQAFSSHKLELARTSHDFKQPIFSARMALMTLKANASNEEVIQNLDLSLNEIQSLLTTHVDNLKSRPNLSPSEPLSDLLRVTALLYKHQATKAGAQLRPVDSSSSLLVPSIPFKRLLSNLIVNALKHAECTKIIFGVRRRKDETEVWVLDNGIGMNIHEQTTSDTGLGLGAVYKICQEQHWSLEIISAPGSGVCVKIGISEGKTSKPSP